MTANLVCTPPIIRNHQPSSEYLIGGNPPITSARLGRPMSFSTASKLSAQGEFAIPALWWGRRPLYTRDGLRAWDLRSQPAPREEQPATDRTPSLKNKWPIVSAARHRRKRDRIEREIVDRHKMLGVHAERYLPSGVSRFRGSAHHIDFCLFSRAQASVSEVNVCEGGVGFTTLERWLAEYDALFLRRNNADPLVLLSPAVVGRCCDLKVEAGPVGSGPASGLCSRQGEHNNERPQ